MENGQSKKAAFSLRICQWFSEILAKICPESCLQLLNFSILSALMVFDSANGFW